MLALDGQRPWPAPGPARRKAMGTLGKWGCLAYDAAGAVAGLSAKGREVLLFTRRADGQSAESA
jgi:hypothetical protein